MFKVLKELHIPAHRLDDLVNFRSDYLHSADKKTFEKKIKRFNLKYLLVRYITYESIPFILFKLDPTEKYKYHILSPFDKYTYSPEGIYSFAYIEPNKTLLYYIDERMGNKLAYIEALNELWNYYITLSTKQEDMHVY